MRTRRRLLLAAGLGVLALVPTDVAHAGSYKVEMCRLSDGSPAPVSGWSGLHVDSCAGGGSFGLHWPSGAEVNARSDASFGTPANVAISRADIWRFFQAATSSQTAQPRVVSSWESHGWGIDGAHSEDRTYNPAAPATPLSVSGPSSLSMALECAWNGSASPNRCSAPQAYFIYKLDLTMADGIAPQVTSDPAGQLLTPGWLTGTTATLSIGASDTGAGAYRAFIREGSTTQYALLDPMRASCRDAEATTGTAYEFTSLLPCSTAGAMYSPSFKLTSLGDGVHTVSIGIEDAAGNERLALAGQTLRVNAPGGTLGDPGTPCAGGTYDEAGVCRAAPSGGGGGGGGGTGGSGSVTDVKPGGGGGGGAAPNPEPQPQPQPAPVPPPPAATRRSNGSGATSAAALSLRVGGTVRREVSVPYGREVVVEGRLTSTKGDPIGGATIEVFTARRAGGQTVHETPVVSARDGAFRAVLRPGPSRTVRFAYRAYDDDTEYAESADLDVRVRTTARLNAAPRRLRNGRSVRFRGTVAGAPKGSHKVVEMQVRQGDRWLTFATTRLHGGRFGYRYRFTRTVRTTSYVFRAVVRTDAGWPYETGVSNRVSVAVRP